MKAPRRQQHLQTKSQSPPNEAYAVRHSKERAMTPTPARPSKKGTRELGHGRSVCGTSPYILGNAPAIAESETEEAERVARVVPDFLYNDRHRDSVPSLLVSVALVGFLSYYCMRYPSYTLCSLTPTLQATDMGCNSSLSLFRPVTCQLFSYLS